MLQGCTPSPAPARGRRAGQSPALGEPSPQHTRESETRRQDPAHLLLRIRSPVRPPGTLHTCRSWTCLGDGKKPDTRQHWVRLRQREASGTEKQRAHGRKGSVAACQRLGGSHGGKGQTPPPRDTCCPELTSGGSFPSGFGLRFAPSHETGLASPVPGPRARRCCRGWTDRHLEGRCPCAHTWLCSGWRRHPGGCMQRGRNGTDPSVFPGPPDPGPPWAAEEPHTGRRSGAAGGSESGGRGCLGWGAALGSPIQGPSPHVGTD